MGFKFELTVIKKSIHQSFISIAIAIAICFKVRTHTLVETEFSARIYRPSFHENKPKTLAFDHFKIKRFGLVFAKTGSINSDTVVLDTFLTNILDQGMT